jgi:HEAT repeat protein
VILAGPANETDKEFIRELQLAISEIGPAAAPAVPALVRSLKSDDTRIQASAAYALGKIGPPAVGAVSQLRANLLNSADRVVKLTAVTALLRIQPDQRSVLMITAGPLLVDALKDERDLVRIEAASVLGEIPELGKRAISQLKELLEDESEMVRKAAEIALEKLEG